MEQQIEKGSAEFEEAVEVFWTRRDADLELARRSWYKLSPEVGEEENAELGVIISDLQAAFDAKNLVEFLKLFNRFVSRHTRIRLALQKNP